MKLTLLILFIAVQLAHCSNVSKFLLADNFEEGWTFEFAPEIYTPENLYEYINGEAEIYKRYDFVEMATASYVLKVDPAATFTLDIYDMGTALNAFGIYSSYRRPELHFEEIGAEATVSELNIRFYKGQYFVQVNAGSMVPIIREIIQRIARKISESLPAVQSIPELGLLLAEYQVEHSMRYIKNGFLGQESFKKIFEAQYKKNKNSWSAFIALFENDEKALDAFLQYEKNISDWGKIIKPTNKMKNCLVAETEETGMLRCQIVNNYIVGVYGYKNSTEAEQALEKQIKKMN